MVNRIIPLVAGQPFQTFNIPLGAYTLAFSFSWVQRFGYFRVDIDDITSNRATVTRGRVANPDVDLFNGLIVPYGRVYMTGPQPTLENIGIAARLEWEPTNG